MENDLKEGRVNILNKKIEVFAPAKINLTLDVIGKRADGYHFVEMVMQSISLGDIISICLRDRQKTTSRIRVCSSHPDLPDDTSNLAFQAARIFVDTLSAQRSWQYVPDIEICIQKEIPLAAGLGGGSTDAAGVLRGLNDLFEHPFSRLELQRMGAELGADVPFCIEGGTALATGIGTELKPLPCPPAFWLVLVSPNFMVSTARVYQNLNWKEIKVHPPTCQVIDYLVRREFPPLEMLVNVLEEATYQLYPQLKEYRGVMEDLFEKVLMSGSGPTLMGFTRSKALARTKGEHLREILQKKGLRAKVAVVCSVGKDFQSEC